MKHSKLYLSSYIFIFLIFCSCSSRQAENSGDRRSVILVEPISADTETSKIYSGILEENKSVNASFMADGRISKIMVKEGDKVRKDQILAILDDTDYQIGVNQLRTQFRQMTEEKKRMDEMFARHNVAPNDYEKFVAGYEQLGLQLKSAENRLEYTKLKSPSEGYISEKFMESGELVGAGTPILKITDDSRLIVNVDLPVSVFLKKGDIRKVVGLSEVFPSQEIPLKVESFTPDAENNMLYHMKLSMPQSFSSSLTPGMNMNVRITLEGKNDEGSLVPSRAIFEDNGCSFVWIYNPQDSVISKKSVTTIGVEEGSMSKVVGLSGNEKIVETGVKQLYDGEKVNVVKKSDFGL